MVNANAESLSAKQKRHTHTSHAPTYLHTLHSNTRLALRMAHSSPARTVHLDLNSHVCASPCCGQAAQRAQSAAFFFRPPFLAFLFSLSRIAPLCFLSASRSTTSSSRSSSNSSSEGASWLGLGLGLGLG